MQHKYLLTHKCNIKKLLLLVTGFLSFFSAPAQNGHWIWAKTAVDGGNAETKSFCTDKSGNVYATGSFEGSIQFGNTILVALGKKDVWLTKYDRNGQPIWATAIGSIDNDEGIGVATDDNENVYITGTYTNTLAITATDSLEIFGPYLTHIPNPDIFIIKYNNIGELIWQQRAGSNFEDIVVDIKYDNAGHLYTAGTFSKLSGSPPPDSVAGYFGKDTIQAYKGYNGFLVKYDTSGNTVWAKSVGDEGGNENITSFDISATGDLYLGGTFGYYLIVDHLILLSKAVGLVAGDMFLLKLDSSGNAKWLNGASGSRPPSGSTWGSISHGYVCVTDNNVYITGTYFDCDMHFDSHTIKSIGGFDVYLAKYSNTGALLWVESGGITSNESALGITADNAENIYITGTYDEIGGTIIAGDTIQGRGSNLETNIYIGKYNKNGEGIWCTTAGGSGRDYPSKIAANEDGSLFVAGSINNANVLFGNITLDAQNNANMFIAKFQGYPTSVSKVNTGGVAISIYPNPATNIINMSGIPDGSIVNVFDIYGRKVLGTVPLFGTDNLSLESLTPGNYVLQVTTSIGERLFQQMLVKL